MRSVSVRARSAAVLLLVLFFTLPVIGDEPTPSTEPQSRIHIPVGVTAEEEPPSVWEFFLVWLQGRIQPPVG